MTRAELVPLVQELADGIRVFRTRDGKPLTDEECMERAANLAMRLQERFLLIPRPDVEDGKPVGHSWSCRCLECSAYKERTRS